MVNLLLDRNIKFHNLLKWFLNDSKTIFKQFQQEKVDEQQGFPGLDGTHDIVFSIGEYSIQKFLGRGQ